MSINIDTSDLQGVALKAFSFGKQLVKQGRNLALNMTEIEIKVMEATGSEAWGPSGTQLHDISMATTDPSQRQLIFQVLWERMKESTSNWRKVYKALNVLDYCLKNGTKRFVEEARECMHKIEDLKSFYYTEPDTGKDQGINVREKAKQLIELLSSTEKLTEEREKARRARQRFHNDKMGGFSSEDFRSGSKGSSFDDDDFDRKRDLKKREAKSIQDDNGDDWGEHKDGGGVGGGSSSSLKISIKPVGGGSVAQPAAAQTDLLELGTAGDLTGGGPTDDAWADFGEDPFAAPAAAGGNPSGSTSEDPFGDFAGGFGSEQEFGAGGAAFAAPPPAAKPAGSVDLLADVFSAPSIAPAMQAGNSGGGFDVFGLEAGSGGVMPAAVSPGPGGVMPFADQTPQSPGFSSLVNLDSLTLNGGAAKQTNAGPRPSMASMAMSGQGNMIPVSAAGGGMGGMASGMMGMQGGYRMQGGGMGGHMMGGGMQGVGGVGGGMQGPNGMGGMGMGANVPQGGGMGMGALGGMGGGLTMGGGMGGGMGGPHGGGMGGGMGGMGGHGGGGPVAPSTQAKLGLKDASDPFSFL